jgi:hypothetical protein
VALSLNRLIRNIANLKNKETAKNKLLKTKPKIQQMKQNVEKAKDEAAAIHDYVVQAEVAMASDSSVPPFESNSFSPLVDAISLLLDPTAAGNRASILSNLRTGLRIGIMIDNGGRRYLTTAARAAQLDGSFTEITSTLASTLGSGGGTIK